MSRILFLSSNPGDTTLLRLDKEHRAVDEAKARFGSKSDTVERHHATTLEDLTRTLTESQYDIVQFSGHGSVEGIVLEDVNLDGSSLISAQQLGAILFEAQSNLRVTILMCCFSSGAIPQMIRAAPYLITVSGKGNDETVIDFVRVFYETFFQRRSIEKAFYMAQLFVSGKKPRLHAVLSRRAEAERPDVPLYQAFPSGPEGKGDSILVDLSAAEDDISKLKISREEFLAVLSRKIRIHRWIFSYPRDRAVLSIGHLFGIFSWKDAHDVVTCHRILQLRETVDELCCEAWTSLVLSYNEQCMSKYRMAKGPANVNARFLKTAIEEFYRNYHYYFDNDHVASYLRKCLPQQFKICRSLIGANLQLADLKYSAEDFGSAIMYLEGALSSLHDFVDTLTSLFTE